MAKRTAVIDIGSNSVRIVIYEKTSRFAFHLIREAKSKVRIGQGAYTQNGYLQDEAMQRAFETLEEFVSLAHSYKCRKILCVATSALRDAPNKNVFLNRVAKKLNLHIKIIDGNEEALLGGIAAANMLPKQNAVTIDIGGGSTELASISNGAVLQTVSLDLGTVRLNELFCNHDRFDDAVSFIHEVAQAIPDSFFEHKIIGIGGTIRAISTAYLRDSDYPIKVLHGFTYQSSAIIEFSSKLFLRPEKEIKNLGIKQERIDVIDAGTLIFTTLLKILRAPKVTVSQVGVREGRFIQDMLRNQKEYRFATHLNPTMQSLIDRYIDDEQYSKNLKRLSLDLFDILQEFFDLPDKYRMLLGYAALLTHIGIDLNYYDFERHSFYLILHSTYGLSHKQILLVATLVRYHTKKKPSHAFKRKYGELLPKNRHIKSLIYILALGSAMLKANPNKIPFEYEFIDNTLHLKCLAKNHLAIEKIGRLESPFEIVIT